MSVLIVTLAFPPLHVAVPNVIVPVGVVSPVSPPESPPEEPVVVTCIVPEPTFPALSEISTFILYVVPAFNPLNV